MYVNYIIPCPCLFNFISSFIPSLIFNVSTYQNNNWFAYLLGRCIRREYQPITPINDGKYSMHTITLCIILLVCFAYSEYTFLNLSPMILVTEPLHLLFLHLLFDFNN